MPRICLGLIVIFTALPMPGQQVAFDAASVKPAMQAEGLIQPVRESNPGRVTYKNYSLKRLLTEVYHLTRYQVEGPPWIERDRYDIVATKPRGTTADQERQMLQRLLEERFHIAQHFESKEMPAYALLPGKDISVLHAAKGGGDAPGCASSGTMAQYAEMLAAALNKPVVDQTGISGRYYFILAWSDVPMVRTDAEGAPPPPPPPPSLSAACPGWTGKWPTPAASVFDAVREQMGLRLERRGTATVKVLVLDRVQKATAN